MSGVRDPAFWKRFSVAVHMDEEEGPKQDLKHSDSWLARQNRKRSSRSYVCWLFWFLFLCFVAGVIAVIIWLLQSGVLDQVKIGNGHGTPEPITTGNGDLPAPPPSGTAG